MRSLMLIPYSISFSSDKIGFKKTSKFGFIQPTDTPLIKKLIKYYFFQ